MSPPTRHLTVVTPTFHPEPIGTPLYATDLSRWFAARGWSVQVVTAQPFYPQFHRHEGYGRRTRIDALDNINIMRLPTVVPHQGRRSLRAISDLNFAIQGLARSGRLRLTDAVLSISPGNPWTALVGAAISRRSTPHICLVHDIQTGLATGYGTRSLLKVPIRLSERWSLSAADAVATLSTEMMDTLRSIGVRRPLHVLPLWSTVDGLSHFPALEPEVQYSGNFGEKQGIESLPQVAKGLAERHIPLRVRGQGPRFESLLPELHRVSNGLLAVEDLVPVSMLSPALARSPVHIVLQTPGTGGFAMPSKMLNSLACGATVIAMADPDSAIDRLARQVDGLHVVPPRDPGSMVDAVLAHMETARDPSTRRRIATTAEETFSREAVLERLEAALRSGDAGRLDGASGAESRDSL